ncbi:hypothetical protein M0R45_034732 [Rubus argutus]|uniref:Uncharacterized protein n=1 Tax=Rubus argutus TaxID=59490 RepID=A0AAW1VU03_RUBAR
MRLRLTSSGGEDEQQRVRSFFILRLISVISSVRVFSASALPYKRTPPSWFEGFLLRTGEHLQVCQEGPGTISNCVVLCDSHGISQVKSVTGSKILRILEAHGLAPEIPEDLYHLIKEGYLD